jgi:hypothetical protein
MAQGCGVVPGTSIAEALAWFAPIRVSWAIVKFVTWTRARDGSQEDLMQRKWMRALIVVAVSAVSVLLTGEADAQGPVRRLFRRMTGRDNVVSANTYIDANGNRVMVRDGYSYSTGYSAGRFDANGRWIGPMDRTANGTRVETRIDGQVAPATRIEADADVRTAPGDATIRGRATGDADVDINRNDGTIRGRVDGSTSQGATIAPQGTPARTLPGNSTLPQPGTALPQPGTALPQPGTALPQPSAPAVPDVRVP